MSETRLKRLFSRLGDEGERRGWSCPDEDALAAYFEGGLSSSERKRLEGHLSRCGHCLGQIRFLLRTEELEEPERVPARLVSAVTASRATPGWTESRAGRALLAATVTGFFLVTMWRLQPVEENMREGARESVVSDSQSDAMGFRTIRGDDAVQASFHVVSPREGAGVRRDALKVAWKPLAGAVQYTVRLTDAEGRLLWDVRTETLSVRIPEEVDIPFGAEHYLLVSARLRSGEQVQATTVRFFAVAE